MQSEKNITALLTVIAIALVSLSRKKLMDRGHAVLFFILALAFSPVTMFNKCLFNLIESNVFLLVIPSVENSSLPFSSFFLGDQLASGNVSTEKNDSHSRKTSWYVPTPDRYGWQSTLPTIQRYIPQQKLANEMKGSSFFYQ